MPLGTRGGLLIHHNFALDGEYDFKTKLALNTSAKVRGLDYPNDFVITVDGAIVHRATMGGKADEDASDDNSSDGENAILARLEAKIPIKAGPHTVGIAFIQKTSAQPPMTNLLATMLDKIGVAEDHVGDSTGELMDL